MDNIAVSCVLNILSFHAIFASSIRRDYGVDTEPDPKSAEAIELTPEDMARLHIWQTGIIPYHIDDFSFDKVLRDRIRMYLNEVNRITLLRFEEIPRPPSDNDTRWVLFLNRRSLLRCAGNDFNKFSDNGVQTVVLGYDCMNSDENLAAIVLSLVGVPPQHNAPFRDEFISIMKENILPDKLNFFEKIKHSDWKFHQLKHDYDSAGHYGPYKYTSNGKVTVKRKPRSYYFLNSLGPPPPKPKEKGFSKLDVLKIAMLYKNITSKQEIPVPGCSELYGQKVRLMKYREKPIQYLGGSVKKHVYDEKKQNKKTSKSESYENYDGDGNESEYENGNYPEEDYTEETDYVNNDDDDDDDDYDDDDDDDNEGYDNIDNYGYFINNNKDGKEKRNEKKYAGNKNDTKLKDKIFDGNKKSGHEDSKSDVTENQKPLSPTTTTTTAFPPTTSPPRSTTTHSPYDRMPLILNRKLKKSNKKSLLGQSDYETGDEDKNKYIHEKNL